MRVKAGQSIALALMASLLLFTGSVQAASLGKIEVTSYIGEPFHALVPLKLDSGESASEISVEIASPADYRIFEVYRDGALSLIRSDVVSDGSSVRVELSSTAPLKSPFFNLILKTQKGRVTHFKKYPVFLELPKMIQKSAAETAAVTAVEEPIVEVKKGVAAPEVERFDGWARTGRYGPIVRGDTLYTVAQRLSADSRYTRNQVMVALYEKNRDKFSMDNINLLRAGSYLETPKAAEVERISARQASEIVTEHEKRWSELTKQPRYAAELLAQKTRYSKKISVGEQMDGVATAPAVGVAEKKEPTARPGQEKAAEAEPTPGAAEAALKAQEDAAAKKAMNDELLALKEENANLQKQLDDSKKQIETLSQKVDSITKEATDASKAAVARLQTMVKQLQAELDEARKQAVGGSDEPDWLVMGLAGAIVLLLVIILLLKRRENQQTTPATQESEEAEAEFETEEEMAEAVEAAPSLMEPMFEPQEQEETEPTFPEFEEEETEVEGRELELPVGEQIFKERNPEEMKHFADARSDSDMFADYLQEADTYIRYGMDDEALQQVNQALRVKPDSADAYSKKARILNNKGDRQAFEETVEAANAALTGEELERFAADLLEITGAGEEAESVEVAVEDEAPAVEAQPEDETQAESETQAEGEIDFEEAGATIAFSNILDEQPHLSEEGEAQPEESVEGESEEETVGADLEASTDEPDEVEFDRADATIAFSQMLDGNEEPTAVPEESAESDSEEVLGSELEAPIEEQGTEDEVEFDGSDATIMFGKMLDEKAEQAAEGEAESEDLSPALDMDHGSTEELKTLLEEFPEEEEVDQASASSEKEDDVIEGYELDIGGNTTREFNEMLNDFSSFESEDEDLTAPKVQVATPEDEPEGAVYDLSLDDYSTREFEKITDFSDYEQGAATEETDQEQSEAEKSDDQESSDEAEKKELDDLLSKFSDNEGEEEEGKE